MTKLALPVVASVLAGSLLAGGVARAEERAGMYGNLMGTWYGHSVKGFPDGIPSAFDSRYEPGKCAEWTAAEKKDGAKPTDTLVGDYKGHPKAKEVSGGRFSIPFSEAGAICVAYEAQLKLALGQQSIKKSVEYMKDKKGPPTAADAKSFNEGAGQGIATMGKDCLASLDGLAKNGATSFKVNGAEMKLDDLKTTCQAAVDYGTAFEGFIKEEKKGKRDEIAKKYIAAGIKGARLELFIEYDDVYWYNTKCEKTDDVAELKKAKVLMHWLENSDGTQTIRRYTFNGDKVSKTEKTFNTEAAARRACR